MASRATENRILTRHGFIQGIPQYTEQTPCCVCGKNVRGIYSWWRTIDRETDCYCRPCAMMRVFVKGGQ